MDEAASSNRLVLWYRIDDNKTIEVNMFAKIPLMPQKLIKILIGFCRYDSDTVPITLFTEYDDRRITWTN
jgi:hypothetical protein